MIKNLVKVRISSVLHTMNFADKNGNKRKTPMKGLMVLLVAYVAVMLAVMSTLIFLPLCRPFVEAGYGWFYFAFAGIMSFVICFIGSIFSTQAQLFEAKDNELLLSMPIPPAAILVSRMVFLVLMNYVYEAFIMVPAFAVYCAAAPESVTAGVVIMFLICFATLPMLSLSFSGLFGWILSLITSRMRRKNLFITISSFILLGLYFSVYFRIEGYMEDLINNGSEFANAVKNAIFPAYYFGRAISGGTFADAALFAVICIIPFVALCILISMFFARIVSNSGEYKKDTSAPLKFKKNSPKTALLKKELNHFISSPQYIMNAGLGAIFTVVFAVIVVVNKQSVMTALSAVFSSMADQMPELICTTLCLLMSFCFISCPSVSLEAKTLWLIKGIPVSSKDVLLSKALMHIVIAAPLSFIASTVCIFAIDMSAVQMAILIAAPIAVTVFEAFFGVTVNLFFPKFDWTSETVVIKQSASTVITMFSTLGIVGIPSLLYTELLSDTVSASVYFSVFTAAFIALSVLLYRYLCTKGAARFEALQS